MSLFVNRKPKTEISQATSSPPLFFSKKIPTMSSFTFPKERRGSEVTRPKSKRWNRPFFRSRVIQAPSAEEIYRRKSFYRCCLRELRCIRRVQQLKKKKLSALSLKSLNSSFTVSPLSYPFLRSLGADKLFILRRRKASFRSKLKSLRLSKIRRSLFSSRRHRPYFTDRAYRSFRRALFSSLLLRRRFGSWNYSQFLSLWRRRPLPSRVLNSRRFRRGLFSFLRHSPFSLERRPREFRRRLRFFFHRRASRRLSSKIRRLQLKDLFFSLERSFPLSLLRLYWKLKSRSKFFRIFLSVAKLNLCKFKPKIKPRRFLMVHYGEAPKTIRRKAKFKPKWHRSFSSVFVKRSSSYLFALPSLPLWIVHFFYFFFLQQNLLLDSLWLNLFFLSSFKKQPLFFSSLLSLHSYVFFQRQSSLNFAVYDTFLYTIHVFDSLRFLRPSVLSFPDLDRKKLPRRSLWLIRKKPWRRYPQKMFEGYKRFGADAFFEKHIFLSFDYSYSIRFRVLPLSFFSTIKIYRQI